MIFHLYLFFFTNLSLRLSEAVLPDCVLKAAHLTLPATPGTMQAHSGVGTGDGDRRLREEERVACFQMRGRQGRRRRRGAVLRRGGHGRHGQRREGRTLLDGDT